MRTIFFVLLIFRASSSVAQPTYHQQVNVATGEYCDHVVDLPEEGERGYVSRWYRSGEFGPMGGWHSSFPEGQDPRHREAFRVRETESGFSLHTRKGPSVVYSFDEWAENQYPCLSEVAATGSLPLRYEYGNVAGKTHPFLIKSSTPGGDLLHIEYYEWGFNAVADDLIVIDEPNDWRIGRVKAKYVLESLEKEPACLVYFLYEPDRTTAVEVNQARTVYSLDEKRRVTAITQYCENESLYRTQHWVWDERHEERLRFCWLLDETEAFLLGKEWLYDDHGRPVEERLYGNPETLAPLSVKIEPTQRAFFVYDEENPSRLVKKIDFDGTTHDYKYEGNHCVAHCLDQGGGHHERTFYLYDDEGREICRILDDGTGEEIDDLTGVTERRSFSTTYAHTPLYWGMPLIKEVEVWNPEAGERRLVHQERWVYSDQERFVETVEYKEGEEIVAWRLFDQRNRLWKERNAEGVLITYHYDARGDCVEEERSDRLFPIRHTYDGSHRRIRTETTENEGLFRAHSWRYNVLGWLIAESDTYGHEIEYRYDAFGRCIQTIYPLVPYGEEAIMRPVVEKQYDLLNRLVSTVDANGFSYERKTFSEKNLRKEIFPEPHFSSPFPLSEYEVVHPHGFTLICRESVDEEGNRSITWTDAMGRLTEVLHRDGWGRITLHTFFFYDPKGNRIEERHQRLVRGKEGDSFRICRLYGRDDRIEEVAEYVGRRLCKRTSYFYSPEGRIESIEKPDGVGIYYDYNSQERIEAIFAADGTIDEIYTYDEEGRITTIEDRVHGTAHRFVYNEIGQLVEEHQAQGLTMQYVYDEIGRRERIVLPDGSSIFFAYQGRDLARIERRDEGDRLLYHHTYLERTERGLPLRVAYPLAGGEVVFSYDENERVVHTERATFAQQIERGPFGEILRVVTSEEEEVRENRFQYDSEGRLIGADEEKFVYDSLDNCCRNLQGKVYTTELNQPWIVEGKAYRYDPNGNRIATVDEAKGTIYYEYDAFDRLIRMATMTTRVDYTYDAFGRRMSKTGWMFDEEKGLWTCVEEQRFLYDGANEIGSFDERGRWLSLRILGEGFGAEIGAAVAVELEGICYIPVHDYRGSLVQLLDGERGEVVEFYRYSAFGEARIYGSDGKKRESSFFGNPWRFASKRVDEETDFVYFGKRYYEPRAGRWITPDPMGFLDGPNRYAFVRNNPINAIDLYGTLSVSLFFREAAVGGKRIFQFLSEMAQGFSHFLDTVLPFRQRSLQDIGAIYDEFAGKLFLQFTGFYLDPARVGVYGKGEIAPDLRISLINGLFNIHEDCRTIAEWISDTHGSVNVHYVFRPTRGWTWDLFHGMRIKVGFLSEQAAALAKMWKELIEEMGGVEAGGKILHYAHSLGGTDTLRAQTLLTPEERALIHVTTFGSASMTPNLFGFGSLHHYMSVRDGVMVADFLDLFLSMIGVNNDVEFVGSLWGIPFMDHLMGNTTYRTIWEELGKNFVEEYGAVA